ncbi:MAG: UDP-3-O-(3-hydroxymyristoyl)glucosamine N-acyltransferase [Desulfuromonas sp.]|nr:MAG: UDP-3-O-(3-hydroxymyristoyl)glucosamine N-acyltransferase [Desulfuromonas sp.]
MATLKELADLVGGAVVGEDSLEIKRLATIEHAVPGEITFLGNAKYLAYLKDCRASAVIAPPGVEAGGMSVLTCANPYLAVAKVQAHLHVKRPEPLGVLDGAFVHPEAQLGEGVTVHPGCVVERGARIGAGTILYPGVIVYSDAEIGRDCVLHAHSVVREGCLLGQRVILQPGAVIGADGFGYAPDGERYVAIPQVGTVVLEDDVEIGANACIDRGAIGETRIGRGSKIDNLVMIAHNVEIEENCILVSQVGVAGSTKIGKHCTFGGQAGVAGHLKVGANTTVGARGAVMSSYAGDGVISGTPAIPHKEWLKSAKVYTRLPEMRREIQRLKKEVAALQDQKAKEN